MKQRLLTAAALSTLALFAASASADVAGGTSNASNVAPAESSFPFTSGKAGLIFNNSGSFAIDLAGGPIQYANSAITRGPNGSGNYYLRGEDIGFLPGLLFGDIAQVWRNDVVYNGQTTAINSLRQLITPSGILQGLMPNFGGLVIATVPGSPVYFGEWSPKPSGSIPYASTDLNMGSAQRTVWYTGENPTTSMPALTNVQYNVVGINQHNPASPSVYQGVLTASYASGAGSLTGNLTRSGSTTVAFGGDTVITSSGTFANSANTINGRFYGTNAAALAGIYTGGGVQDHVAFGGTKQ